MVAKPRILGTLLVEMGAVGEKDLASALDEQNRSGRRLGEILVRMGLSDEEAVARALAIQLNLPYLDPPLAGDPEIRSLIRPDLARKRKIFPLSATRKTVRVAMADPLDLDTIDDLQFQTGRRVEAVVASPFAVEDALLRSSGGEISRLVSQLPGELTRIREDDGDALEKAARAAPVVRLVDHILKRAIKEDASDIHIERVRDALQIRYRIDGILRRMLELPSASHGAVISRLKVMAGMDISIKRRPQDGGLALRDEEAQLSLRVSTLPASGGEKAVIRILDAREAPKSLDELGFSEPDLARVRKLLRAGQGVILASGPTGSGKSSTLFGALGELDRDGRNIVTLEDPVEYRMNGVHQVQMDPRSGLTFPAALRSVLRQDPDIVMVGEIRDRETAEIAMTAAVTGHLVLSTIHTTDAPGAITRLLNMGVPPFLVAGGLTGVVAQRLLRRLCPSCRGEGWERCARCPDGYRGRTGIFQVLVMTDALREEVVRGASTNVLRRLAGEAGLRSLTEDARRKVAEFLTSPHEVGRVIQADPGATMPCGACGASVPIGALGCPRCGRSQRAVCACGRDLKKGWGFCAWCLRPTRR